MAVETAVTRTQIQLRYQLVLIKETRVPVLIIDDAFSN